MKPNLMKVFGVSLEEVATVAKASSECEYEIYGTLADMSVLASAARSELQEQWGLPVEKVQANAASGSLRVRLTTISGKPQYNFTSKVKRDNDNSELEFETNEELFKHFKLFATQGMIKTRYFFPVEGGDFVYEVDVFTNPDGTPNPRVKIDLEIQGQGGIDSLPDFPFELNDITVIPPGRKSAEHLAFVRDLYDNHYTMKNQFINAIPVIPAATSMEDSTTDKDIKNSLFKIAVQASGIEGALTANGSEAEARVKHLLEELTMAVRQMYAEENYP